MKIPNQKLLDEFRTGGRCEVCKKWCERREPMHLFASGLGGCPLDVRINLLAGGSTRLKACFCHSASHSKSYGEYDPQFLDIIASREGEKPEDVVAVLRLLKRLTKPNVTEIMAGLATLETQAQHALALKELQESGVLT